MTDGINPGARLLAGRYQVGNLIGRGGMADVHLGLDTRLNRRVAIKLLKPALATDPSFRSRFRREAQDAAKMAHPTIVRMKRRCGMPAGTRFNSRTSSWNTSTEKC